MHWSATTAVWGPPNPELKRPWPLGSGAVTLGVMKPRPRPVTLVAAVLGVGVVGVLVALNWATVIEHTQAWYFLMTTRTRTAYPGSDDDGTSSGNEQVFQVLARCLGDAVTYDSAKSVRRYVIDETIDWRGDRATLFRLLGWRVLEQRFPRRAYIVVAGASADGHGTQEAVSRLRGGGSSTTTIELKATPR